MPSLVRFTSPRVAEVIEEDLAPLGPDQVRLATLFSGISAGTELTAYRGSNPYLNKKWDEERRLFVDGSTCSPTRSTAGGTRRSARSSRSAEDAKDVAVGDRIWGTWGHRASTVQDAERASRRILSPDVDPRIGIFSQIGAIGLNVVLDADIHIGETVAVFGLGVPGRSPLSWPGSTGPG